MSQSYRLCLICKHCLQQVCQGIKNFENDSFRGSTLVIACQSTQKDYEIHNKQEIFKIPKKCLSKNAGMQVHKLSKNMRMCSNLYELVQIAQSKVCPCFNLFSISKYRPSLLS